MKGARRLLTRAATTRPDFALRRIWHETRVRSTALHLRRHDQANPTYSADPEARDLRRLIGDLPYDNARPWFRAIREVTANYLEHRFDLLGSGWVRPSYGAQCQGLEGHRFAPGPRPEPDRDGAWLHGRVTRSNFAASQERWRLVDPGYDPIDWQLDFKSGWRWSALDWYRDAEIVGPTGADPKVPWELARLQHLPQLAVAGGLARAGVDGFEPPHAYEREFRNEVLDFLATNPPRHGINWAMPMEVAIRVVNLLIARDLFLATGAVFDEQFERFIRLGILDHARHLFRNLEWHDRWRGNHFLANLTGLAIAAAYLPTTDESASWARTASTALEIELTQQFWPDGSNSEASTSYHALATELVAYAVAALASRSPDASRRLRLDAAAVLSDAVRFSMDVTTPSGGVVQIGDNDSGRLLKLIPNIRIAAGERAGKPPRDLPQSEAVSGGSTWSTEEHLDHRPVVAAVNGLIECRDAERFAHDFHFVASVVHQLAGGQPRLAASTGPRARTVTVGNERDLTAVRRIIDRTPLASTYTVRFDLPGWPLWQDLERVAYQDFGLFIWRREGFLASVRCGPVGQRGRGGHAHNDQLSIELWVEGSPWIRDPGTYVYTPLPHRRNEYRSVRAHFAPRIGPGEPQSLNHGLFELGSGGSAECLYWGSSGFAGRHLWADGRSAICTVEPGDAGLVARYAAQRGTTEFSGEVDWRDVLPSIAFSPGYGLRERSAT